MDAIESTRFHKTAGIYTYIFPKIFGTKIAIPLLSEIATLLIIKGKMNRTKPLVYKESSRKINSFSHETNGIYKNLKNKILQTA